MASEVSICNLGIVEFLGEEPISDLDDVDNKVSRLCKAIFDEKRDWLLRRHPWTFSKTRVELAPLTTTPAFDWDYQFRKPSDFLRLWEFQKQDIPYLIEGDVILCNESVLYFVYGKQVTDPNKMDPLFRNCLGALIAKSISLNVTDSYDKYRAAKGAFESLLDDARVIDSMEDDTETVEAEDWLESRY